MNAEKIKEIIRILNRNRDRVFSSSNIGLERFKFIELCEEQGIKVTYLDDVESQLANYIQNDKELLEQLKKEKSNIFINEIVPKFTNKDIIKEISEELLEELKIESKKIKDGNSEFNSDIHANDLFKKVILLAVKSENI